MSRRQLPETPRARRQLPETPPQRAERLNRMVFLLPTEYSRYPKFNILSIPIDRATKHRHFLSLIAVMELHTYVRTRTHSTVNILRTHYFYSTARITHLEHTRELLNSRVMALVECVTQELSPEELTHYQEWITTYGIAEATDDSEFWYKFYGIYEEEFLREQKGVSDLFFHPIDFKSTEIAYTFKRDVFPASSTLPAKAPSAATPTQLVPQGAPTKPVDYSAMEEAWDSSTGAPAAIGYIGATCNLGRAIEWGTLGDSASPDVGVTGSLGATATAFGGVGLLFENIAFFRGLERDSYKDPATWISGLSTAANDAGYALWIHSGVTAAAATGVAAAGCDAVVAGLSTIADAYSIYKHSRNKQHMAQCLNVLEQYFEDGNRAYINEAVKADVRTDNFRFYPECASLYVMISWLSRKYRRCCTGKAASLTKNAAGFGLAIGIAVATAAAVTATAGIVLAVGVGLGILYLLISSAVAATRYAHNVEVLTNYKELIEQLYREKRISEPEYKQEQWLFDLASKLHPIRHWAGGATMGDYMRCKIAAFVIIAQQRFASAAAAPAASSVTAAATPTAPVDRRSDMIRFCADVLGDAIGYSEKKHGTYTEHDLSAKVLKLASGIPIRGY